MATSGRLSEHESVVRRLEAVQAIADLALEPLPLADLLDELLERLCVTVNADTATILLLEGDELVVRASRGISAEVEMSQRVPFGRGVAGRVASTRTPMVIRDLREETDVWSRLLHDRLRSLVAVPLVYGDEVFGVLHIGSEHERDMGDELVLLELVAVRAAAAIERARVHEEHERRELRARLLADLSQDLGLNIGDARKALQLAAERIADTIGDACSVYLMSEDGMSLEAVAVHHHDPDQLALIEQVPRLPLTREPDENPDGAERGIRYQPPQDVLHAILEADQLAVFGERLVVASMIVAPLRARGEVIGVANLARTRPDAPAYTPADQAFLEQMAARASVAIDNARLYRQAHDAEQRFRALFNSSRIGYVARDAGGRVVETNDAYAEMVGYGNSKALLGTGIDAMVAPEQVPEEGQFVEAEHDYVRRDGSVLHARVSTSLVRSTEGAPLYTLSVVEDVTDRDRNARALRESRERLAEAQVLAHLGDWDLNVRTNTVTRSDELIRILGEPSSPALALAFDEIVPDDREQVVSAIATATATGEPYRLECRVVGANGIPRDVEVRGYPRRDAAGVVDSIRGTLQDITDRKRVEQALRESEERYRRIVETAREGVWVTDRDTLTTFVNARLAEMLGHRAEDMIGRPATDFVHGDELAKVSERLEQRQASVGGATDVRFVRSDGSSMWGLVSTNATTDEHGEYTGSLSMVVDITERRAAQEQAAELEQQLHQSQKLETVGQLAGGIAHDFNNLLAVILNCARFAGEAVPADHPARADMDEVVRAAERGSQLTRQLLVFGRRQFEKPGVVRIGEVADEMHRLLARTLGEDIELRTAVAEDTSPVLIETGRVEQVILNLAINARDAMPAGGTLTIETANVRLDEDYARQHVGVEAGEYVRLTVADTGHGMPAATAQQAFEPFFTTKPPGTGTGLGLAVVYGAVTQAGGHVEIDSSSRDGTAIVIHLPVADEAQEEPAAVMPAKVERGEGTILLVEDEDALRAITRRILTRHGYDVIDAPSPIVALELCRTVDEPIRLLLTDVVMPGMSGGELAEQVRELREGIRVLFVSGYPGRSGTRPDAAFVEKPFTGDILLRAVQDVLA
jgi:PAS domain S-box-containing protein